MSFDELKIPSSLSTDSKSPTFEKKQFEVEESIDVEVRSNSINIVKHYKYGYSSGYQSIDMSIETAKILRERLNVLKLTSEKIGGDKN